ncbi:MAG TPA: acyltransferase [Edaphobacter sp.]|nr:acyltransferase [Edaphobacter sp.]
MAETFVAAAPAQPTTASHPKRMAHIRALDGVRGLAIALVLMVHLLESNDNPEGSYFLHLLIKIKGAGWVGVDLFFALSGFLITGILFDSLGEAHYFRNFYVRRALRIFPLYYGVLLILFLVFRPTWDTGRQLYLQLAYLQNTSLWWHAPQVGMLRGLTVHLWSLAVEEQFYLVWPVLVFLVRDRRKLMWVAFGLALMAPLVRTALLMHGAGFATTYTSTICRADSLLSGAWLALAVRGERRNRLARLAPITFWIAILCCVAIAWKTGTFSWDKNVLVNTVGYSALAVAATSLIAMALRPNSAATAIVDISPLRWLGKYSYGIYVLHPLLGVLYLPWLLAHVHGKIAQHVVTAIGTLAVALPAAWLSYHFYERRFLKLKRYFE